MWLMIKQRLESDHTLDKVVSDIKSGQTDLLSEGKVLSEALKSESNSSYSKARKRLSLEFLKEVLFRTGRVAEEESGQSVQAVILDGTHYRVESPTIDILNKYPRVVTSKPLFTTLIRAVAVFSAVSGSLIDVQWADYFQSELQLATEILKRNQGLLFIADACYGIFSFFQASREFKTHLLSRLTKSRAMKLVRLNNLKLIPGTDVILQWHHSRADKLLKGASAEPVTGRFICYRLTGNGFRPKDIYLFCDITDYNLYSTENLIELFGQKWNIEIYFRHIKSTLKPDSFNSKSSEMTDKEIATGLIAYNLIRYCMQKVAVRHNKPFLKISFSGSRRRVLGFLLTAFSRDRTDQKKPKFTFEKLLLSISGCIIANTINKPAIQPRKIRPEGNRKFPTFSGSREVEIRKLLNKYGAVD